jgi:anti-sigma factor RsiW
MLTCYRTRRRIGAYLDGALGDRESGVAAAHLAACPRCHAELDALRKISVRLKRDLASPAAPVWTGFWEGVRRGIEDSRGQIPTRARPRWRRQLVVSAAAAMAVVTVGIWWQMSRPPLVAQADAAISVSSAETEHPNRTVMIYTSPEKDLAVVWVFDPGD